MALPRFPEGLKPLVSGYRIGAPNGIIATEVAGGLPRIGMLWDRAPQAFSVKLLNNLLRQAVWTAFFVKQIRSGSLPFTMPLNSGIGGLQDHVCVMVPESYSSEPQGSGLHWDVSFTVLAEGRGHAMTDADADAMVAVWNDLGETTPTVMGLLAQMATVDSLTWEDSSP